MRALKVLSAAAIAVLAVGLAVFGWLRLSPRVVPDGQPPLASIDAGSLPSLRETFNAAEGEVRVLALLSPT